MKQKLSDQLTEDSYDLNNYNNDKNEDMHMLTIIGPKDLKLSINEIMKNYITPRIRKSKEDSEEGTKVEYKHK